MLCSLPIFSETVTHKSDVGGVKLNIKSKAEIREAWDSIRSSVDRIGAEHFDGVSVQPMFKIEDGIELILGSLVDCQFGSLVLFGAGGRMVEIFRDSALGIPPLNPTVAQLQLEQTCIYKALKGHSGQRFPGVDIDALNKALCKFSQMVCDLSGLVAECDINPLLALPDRLVALDARIVLRKMGCSVPRCALRAYPQKYIWHFTKKDRNFTIRPTYSGDTQLAVDWSRKLSTESVTHSYLREVSMEERTSKQRTVMITDVDYARTIPLALVDDAANEMIGLAQVTRWPSVLTTADLKIVIRDDAQKKGFGTILMEHLVEVAKMEQLGRLYCLVYKNNCVFLKMAGKFGMKCHPSILNPEIVQCTLIL